MKTGTAAALAFIALLVFLPALAGEKAEKGDENVRIVDDPNYRRESRITIQKFEIVSKGKIRITVSGTADYPEGARLNVVLEMVERVKGVPVHAESVYVKKGRFAAHVTLGANERLMSAYYRADVVFKPGSQTPEVIEKLKKSGRKAAVERESSGTLFGTKESMERQLAEMKAAYETAVNELAALYVEINTIYLAAKPEKKKDDGEKKPEGADSPLRASGDEGPEPLAEPADFKGEKQSKWTEFLAGFREKIEKTRTALRKNTTSAYKAVPMAGCAEKLDKVCDGLLKRAAFFSVYLYKLYDMEPNAKDVEVSGSGAKMHKANIFRRINAVRSEWGITAKAKKPEAQNTPK